MIIDGAVVEQAGNGVAAAIVTNQTPFYGESGGQQGDQGIMTTADGAIFEVSDTQKKLGDLHVHQGVVSGGTIGVGDVVEMRVDADRRRGLRAHHSATHLLHAALRRRLGAHVTQKGSLVAPDRLRFDISHPTPMSEADIAAVEADVNAQILGNAEVSTRLMAPDQAVEAGALALFGEKYGDEVRVVAMGHADADHGDHSYSTELCGGTHVRRTGDIGPFKIVAESAVAAGVRRIEALAGPAALDYLSAQDRQLREAAALLKVTPAELGDRVTALLDERRKLERELARARQALASGGGEAEAARDVNGVAFAAQRLDGVPAKELRGMVDAAKKRLGSGVVAFVAVNDGKAALTVGVTDDLTGRFSAVELVRSGAAAVGGKGGGGRPDMAQAGGPDGAAADAALAAIEKVLSGDAQAA